MSKKILILSVGLLAAVLAASKNTHAVETPADLINEAHKYDNMYSLGPQTSQQKALALYQAALAAQPDDKQRLQILYRMAQLYGSAYQLEKGEKPDFRKAIELYERIIDSYTPEEPLVYKAMISIGDHCTTLREFEKALEWHKKALHYDTARMAEELNTLKNKEMPRIEFTPDGPRPEHFTKEQLLEQKKQHNRAKLLEKSLREIRRYQKFAVDQVAYSAGLIDPLRAHGELRAIIEKHDSSFIADRAAERLKENMDKFPQLWAPNNQPPSPSSNAALQPDISASGAITPTDIGMHVQTDILPEPAKAPRSTEPDKDKPPQKDGRTARARAPPPGYLPIVIIAGAAGLILLALAAIIRRKRKTLS